MFYQFLRNTIKCNSFAIVNEVSRNKHNKKCAYLHKNTLKYYFLCHGELEQKKIKTELHCLKNEVKITSTSKIAQNLLSGLISFSEARPPQSLSNDKSS